MTIDTEIAGIERWLKATKMPEARLGLLAAANPRAVERIRDGTARVSTLRSILKYIRANPASKFETK